MSGNRDKLFIFAMGILCCVLGVIPAFGGEVGKPPRRAYGLIKGVCMSPEFCYVVAYRHNGGKIGGQQFKYYPGGDAWWGDPAHEYTILNLNAGTYDFHAYGSGYIERVYSNVTIPCTLHVSLMEEGKIQGTVTESGGSGIERVVVTATDGSGFSVSGATDVTGFYRIRMVPPGTYTVTAFTLDYEFSTMEGVTVNAGQTVSGIDLTGTPVEPEPDGRIAGTVTKSGGAGPIEGAFVWIEDSAGEPGVGIATDSGGGYEIKRLDSGDYTVKVSEEGIVLGEISGVSVSDGETTNVDFSISIGSISGSVVYSDQSPVEGAMITATVGDEMYSEKSGVDGSYVIENIAPGTYQVSAFVNGRYEERKIQDVVVTANIDTSGQDFVIAIEPIGEVSGVVTDSGGAAIENAMVSASNEDPSGGGVLTGSDGSYTIVGLPGGTYDVAALAEGYVSQSEVDVVVTAGQTSSGHDFSLGTEGGSISGIVYESDGVTPISGALVSCYCPGKSIGQGLSDENGEYLIVLLQAGSYEVMAFAEGYEMETLSDVVVTVPVENSGNDFTLDAE